MRLRHGWEEWVLPGAVESTVFASVGINGVGGGESSDEGEEVGTGGSGGTAATTVSDGEEREVEKGLFLL